VGLCGGKFPWGLQQSAHGPNEGEDKNEGDENDKVEDPQKDVLGTGKTQRRGKRAYERQMLRDSRGSS